MIQYDMSLGTATLAACTVVTLILLGCSGGDLQPEKPHHRGYGYRNVSSSDDSSFIDFLTWRWNRLWKEIPPAGSYNFSLAENDTEFLRSKHDKTTVTWIGHATVLLQLEGKNILTDPHFSERASPVQWVGPKRVVPPGVPLRELPRIDLVVISHDHYDSLDSHTIRRLRDREGGEKTHFFVPLGLKRWLEDLGVTRVTEMDWWEERGVNDLEVVAVPVHHWSKRGWLPRNTTLWAGWVIRSHNFRFFFAGDSGYSPIFREIGRRLGPFDLSAIPIGAYEPRWFMRHHHMSPEEAVQVHADVHSKKSVAIHWGTFMLTDEPLDEPPKRLEAALAQNERSNEEFVVLKHGETIILNGDERR
jgi:L-ascorbate metabolism protein UlaG (beta-lactamase superfamily)